LPGTRSGRRQGHRPPRLTPDLTVVILGNTGTTDLDELVAEIGKRAVR
jgi:hypothetical protein